MPENRLNVRLSLKYDSYENWKTRNPVLLKGEVAFTTIPEGDTSGEARELPAVLVKVGDGEHAYNDLKFISAKAADVSEWAKADTKPEYTATEIKDLDTYIQGLSDVDTDTQYTIVPVEGNAYQYKLMSKAKGDEEFTPVATLDIPKYDDTALTARVNGIDERLTTAEGDIDTLQSQIGGLTGAMHFKGVVDVNPATMTEEDFVVTDDEGNTTPKYASGDVVLYSKKEYVFDATQNKFIELGDEGSLVTRDELTDATTTSKNYTDEQIAALKTELILDCGDSNIATTNEGTETEPEDPTENGTEGTDEGTEPQA